MGERLTVCALGPTGYREGLALQEGLVAARAAGTTGDWLLYPDHPPVLTVGRGGHEESLKVGPETLARLGIERFDVARGGDVTWHGPGQLVGYPIVALARRGRDLHRFLRELEGALIAVLADYGLRGERVPGRTGVWVGGEKIASIGIAVRRWVSYHGFALNVAPDLASFELIHPCGLRGIHMTSMAARLGDGKAPLAEVRDRVTRALARTLGYDGVVTVPAPEAWRAARPADASGPGAPRHDAA